MLYQNLPDYRGNNGIRPQPLAGRRQIAVSGPRPVPVQPRRPARSFTAETQPMPKRSRSMAFVGIFIVALISLVVFHSYGATNGIAHAFSNLTTSATEKEAAAKEARVNTYKSTVSQLIAAHADANIAVSTIDLGNNAAITLGDQGTFTAASTAKLLTAVVLLHEIEKGDLTLNTTIDGQSARTLLQNMIINSDNDAWQSLNDYLTHDTLQSYASSLGWKDYDPDVNTLLPADMALLAGKLYQGKLLNSSNTSLLLSLMKQANKQEYIVDSVQSTNSNLTVYHKAGWLDGLMHDVAIVSNGKQSIVLAIYTYNNGQGDTAANQQLFKQITTAALTAYFPASTAE